jgi:D-beta-D-heptose 7-phosphate kinase/D-beta-D-heptose 1-phosphate adenosyltransferase|tara:strand:- start:5551 stop:6465 length:915 start_codon:yes stop_codon:yes gene_type:complete
MKLDFSDINVLLIGDLMIDHYIIGTSSRMSPEAPVPVVTPIKEYSVPGGAANVALNLRTMGARIKCLGVVGDDIWGEKLLSILKNHGIKTDGIDIIKNHPTTLKQRIYSNGKQVARMDTEKIINNHFFANIDFSKHLKNQHVCIISDYNKGVIQNANIDADILIVDPKKDNFSLYQDADIITPNINELQRASKIKIHNNQSIVDACNELIKKNNFNYIVAKNGSRGMIIVGKDGFVKHIGAHPVNSPDVTGAGDTVISALSLAYTKTNDIELASLFANSAAAIAVSKSGTATAELNEIDKLLIK